MKRTRWFEPYREVNGQQRAALSDKWNEKRSGVYFIRSQATGKIVYVGQSGTQLKKTIYRHFQEWDDKSRDHARIVYEKEGFDIRIIYCTPSQAEHLERYFIKRWQPRDNALKYRNWFQQLTDPSEERMKRLAAEAELSPFLKKADYIDEELPF